MDYNTITVISISKTLMISLFSQAVSITDTYINAHILIWCLLLLMFSGTSLYSKIICIVLYK